MDKKDLENIVNYLVRQGLKAIRENTDEKSLPIDYVAIFSRDEQEFENLELLVRSLGREVYKKAAKTGPTFLLNKPLVTPAGQVGLIKVRLPDLTRPQRGAPDFRVKKYDDFKSKYLQKSGNFTLMVRKDFEMIELKGIDVLVYFPNKPLGSKYDGESG